MGEAALNAAPLWAHWPARLQRLSDGPLVARLGAAREIWLDGGHNPAAGEAIARFFDTALPDGAKLTLLIGMLANKDMAGFLAPLRPHIGAIHSVPVDVHAHHGPEAFGALVGEWGIAHHAHLSLETATKRIGQDDTTPLLITGSLYLAGEVLKANDQLPD